MQRLAVVALALVNGGVPDAAEVVEERALRRPDDVPVPEAVDELLLPLLGADEEADLRRRALREDLAELAQLEERDRGVAREVLLGLRRERDEPRIVVREVGEVRGRAGCSRSTRRGRKRVRAFEPFGHRFRGRAGLDRRREHVRPVHDAVDGTF